MSFFKKIFGSGKQDKPPKNDQSDQLPWIEATDNEWGIRLLDLRPVTQAMMSTSDDPQMAMNAVSLGKEDGRAFWPQHPVQGRPAPANLSFSIDKTLEPGALFLPRVMEHKWAIFFDGAHLLFVRSWTRALLVSAKTAQENNRLIIQQISGAFTDDESFDLTVAILRYLLISHGIGDIVPAPLPGRFESNLNDAGLWAFSTYGKMAQVGVFNSDFVPVSRRPLRSQSLLHIAVARSQIAEIGQQFEKGTPLDYLAVDGLAPLHWAVIVPKSTSSMEKLLELGANPDVKSIEGATPIMDAVQYRKTGHLNVLLQAGASVNAVDNNGFTALHRAADRGYEEMVDMLLKNGADKSIEAKGHTALSFAERRGHEKVMGLLKS